MITDALINGHLPSEVNTDMSEDSDLVDASLNGHDTEDDEVADSGSQEAALDLDELKGAFSAGIDATGFADAAHGRKREPLGQGRVRDF